MSPVDKAKRFFPLDTTEKSLSKSGHVLVVPLHATELGDDTTNVAAEHTLHVCQVRNATQGQHRRNPHNMVKCLNA